MKGIKHITFKHVDVKHLHLHEYKRLHKPMNINSGSIIAGVLTHLSGTTTSDRLKNKDTQRRLLNLVSSRTLCKDEDRVVNDWILLKVLIPLGSYVSRKYGKE